MVSDSRRYSTAAFLPKVSPKHPKPMTSVAVMLAKNEDCEPPARCDTVNAYKGAFMRDILRKTLILGASFLTLPLLAEDLPQQAPQDLNLQTALQAARDVS